MSYQLTRDDLIERFREQVGFLERSAEAFDQGFHDEAKRLAVVVRVLLHDTQSSKSLLGQLGEKNELMLMDTASVIRPDNELSTPGLVLFKLEGGELPAYDAPLGDLSPPRMGKAKLFDPWWNDPVTKASNGLFARRDYILKVANKEGGAHVDPALDKEWAGLTRDNALGWQLVSDGGATEPMGSPVLPSVRQIAYEVDQTLRSQLAHLL